MKFLKLFILFVFVLSSLIITPVIFAEGATGTTPKPPDTTTAIATVNIEDIKIISQDANNFKISFNLTNREGIQSGLRYGVKLIGKSLKGVQYTADEKIYTEDITLNENSSISKEISYSAPSNLTGSYTLWISSSNTSGFIFAFAYAGDVSFSSSVKGIDILTDSCSLSIKEETNNQKYVLLEGVDIASNETLVLNCEAINSSEHEISVTPNYETTYRTAYGDVVPSEGGSLDQIVFKKLEKKTISLNLPKATKPQAYDVKVSLKEGENISNSVIVHYVLRGGSATIQNISLNKDYYNKGETALLSFIWSGQADIFPGNRSGIKVNVSNFIDAEILNSSGKLCAPPIVNQGLDFNSPSPKQGLSIPITSNCKNPKVNITLKDGSGNILDQKSASLETKSGATKSISYIYYIIFIIVIILGVLIYLKKKKKINNIPMQVLFPFLILLAFGSILPNIASADNFTVGDKNGIKANFAINGIKTNYNPGETITFSGIVTISSCNNISFDTSASIKIISFDTSGYTISGETETRYLIDTIATSDGDLNLTPAIFTAPTVAGSYSAILDLVFGKSLKQYSIDFTIGGVDAIGKCAYSSNVPYGCINGALVSKSKVEGTTDWKWQCQGTSSTADCTLSKTKVDGSCGYYINTCDTGTLEDTPDSATKSLWSCKGLYNGVTDSSCSAPLSAQCGTDFETCINGTSDDANTFFDTGNNYYEWYCSSNSNTSIGSLWCHGKTGDLYADIKGYCIVPIDHDSCPLLVYPWTLINNTDKDFKVCGPINCINLNTDEVGSSGQLDLEGSLSYGQSANISIKSSSDQVYKEVTVVPDCNYMGGTWNGNKCVKNGGWTQYGSWSSCSAVCTGKVETISGQSTRSKSCTNPAPSLYGASCVGDNTETQPCSVECLADFPTSPVITGLDEVSTGVSTKFKFLSYDPEGQLIRYGVDWNWNSNIHKPSSYNDYDKIEEWDPIPTGPEGSSYNFTTSGALGEMFHTWGIPGTYTFRAIAQDYSYNVSKNWTYKTVKVNSDAWVHLSANKPKVAPNETVILDWVSGFTDSCTYTNFSPTGSITTKGTANVQPQTKTTYSVTCIPSYQSINKDSVTSSVTVEVVPPSEDPVTVSLTPGAQSVSEGIEARLNWIASNNATSCISSDFTTGGDTQGSISFNAGSPDTYTYTITCLNSNSKKSGEATATVTVTPPVIGCTNPTDPKCNPPITKPIPKIIEI